MAFHSTFTETNTMNKATKTKLEKGPRGTFAHELKRWGKLGRSVLKPGVGAVGVNLPLYEAKTAAEVSEALRKANTEGPPIVPSFNDTYWEWAKEAIKPIRNLGESMYHQANPAGMVRNEQATQDLLATWRHMLKTFDARERSRARVPELPLDAIRQALAQGADPNALTAEDLAAYKANFKLLSMLTIDGIVLPRTLEILTTLINAGWNYPVDFIEAAISAAGHHGSLKPVAELSDIARARWTAEDRAARAGTVTGGSTRQRTRA